MTNRICPLVSVIVLCLKGLALTRKCLLSLHSQDYPNLEIILIDNGSEENFRQMIAAEFKGVRFIRSEKNLGFAGGNNLGIGLAKGKYIALLNNDAIAKSQWVSALVKSAESNELIGAVASKIIDGNNPRILDSFGIGIALDGMSRQNHMGKPLEFATTTLEVIAPSGCACLFRTKALQEVGVFDSDFFAYCEDTDLGIRLWWAGYKVIAAPEAEVIHYYSQTLGKFSNKKVLLVERNHYWAATKNFPLILFPTIFIMTFWRYFIQIYGLIIGQKGLTGFVSNSGLTKILETIVKATVEALQGLPKVIYKRRKSMAMRKISSLEMLGLIYRFRLPITQIVFGTC